MMLGGVITSLLRCSGVPRPSGADHMPLLRSRGLPAHCFRRWAKCMHLWLAIAPSRDTLTVRRRVGRRRCFKASTWTTAVVLGAHNATPNTHTMQCMLLLSQGTFVTPVSQWIDASMWFERWHVRQGNAEGCNPRLPSSGVRAPGSSPSESGSQKQVLAWWNPGRPMLWVFFSRMEHVTMNFLAALSATRRFNSDSDSSLVHSGTLPTLFAANHAITHRQRAHQHQQKQTRGCR